MEYSVCGFSSRPTVPMDIHAKISMQRRTWHRPSFQVNTNCWICVRRMGRFSGKKKSCRQSVSLKSWYDVFFSRIILPRDHAFVHGWPRAIDGHHGMLCPSTTTLSDYVQHWQMPLDHLSPKCHAILVVVPSLNIWIFEDWEKIKENKFHFQIFNKKKMIEIECFRYYGKVLSCCMQFQVKLVI